MKDMMYRILIPIFLTLTIVLIPVSFELTKVNVVLAVVSSFGSLVSLCFCQLSIRKVGTKVG